MSETKNDFSQGSIPRNILSMALPMTLAQIINLLYNIVDRIYIGHIPEASTLALTGVGLTFPIITILMAFANLFGMGGAPLCAISRGEGSNGYAEKIIGNSFTMLVLSGLVMTIMGLLVKEPVLYLFGASDQTFSYANDYITIYLLGNIFVMIGLGMNSFINAQGFGKIGMVTVLLGAVMNIILDPILIFVLGMGVKGAAVATVISQFVSSVWIFSFLTGKKAILKLKLRNMKPDFKLIKKVAGLGLSGFVMALTNSGVQIICNATLAVYGGDLYIGIMTVINSIREVFTMPVNGLINGAMPVMSFNYGAKLYKRVREGIRFSTIVCLIMTVVSWAVLMLFPELFIRIFNKDPELIEYGVSAMRVYFATFFMMTFQFAGQFTFVALGMSKHAVFFSLLRKAIIVIPLTIILPKFWGLGVMGVFWAEPISNLIGGSAAYLTMMKTVWFGRLKEEKAEGGV